LLVVLSGAFDAAFRQLKSFMEKQHGQVKTHPEQENVAVVTHLNAGKATVLSKPTRVVSCIFIVTAC
jgi:hypothetical protein